MGETLIQHVYQLDGLIDARGSISETVKSEFFGIYYIASPLIVEYGNKKIWQKPAQVPHDLHEKQDTVCEVIYEAAIVEIKKHT